MAAEPFTGDPADATGSRGSSWSPALLVAAALVIAASVFPTVPAFVPEMQRLGCVREYLRAVPTYTRVTDDELKGATVVGYVCHAS